MTQLYHLKALTAIMSNSFTFKNKQPLVQGSETTHLRYYWWIIHAIILVLLDPASIFQKMNWKWQDFSISVVVYGA